MSSTPSSSASPTASTSSASASAARVGGEGGGFNSQRLPGGSGIGGGGGGGVKVTPAAPLVRPPAYSDNLSPPFTPPSMTPYSAPSLTPYTAPSIQSITTPIPSTATDINMDNFLSSFGAATKSDFNSPPSRETQRQDPVTSSLRKVGSNSMNNSTPTATGCLAAQVTPTGGMGMGTGMINTGMGTRMGVGMGNLGAGITPQSSYSPTHCPNPVRSGINCVATNLPH